MYGPLFILNFLVTQLNQQSQLYSMTFRQSGQLLLGETNRPTLLPSLKKTCYDQKLFKSRVPYQMSLDEKLYRLTTNQMIKGMIRQNDSEIKKLRTTFLNQKPDEKTRKRIGQYEIIKEIGKGGFAQVYQVEDANHHKYAMKEYNLQNALDCFNNESNVGEHFFVKGQIRKELENLQGHPNLIKFIEKFRIGKYGYIIQQLSEQSLSKNISDIQGIFHNNERIYEVKFKDFYKQLANQNYLKKIMIELCNVVKLINEQGFIHCDLKLQNLMLSFKNNEPVLKLIDFGSTFEMQFGLPKVTITPEYMPPQLLIMLQNGKQQQELLKKIDIWSIGCILLQILTGVPLWFRYKCRVEIKGKPTVQLGIFALTGREYTKIIRKQRQLVDSIQKIPFTLKDFDRFRPILKKLLVLNPDRRISLQQCIQMLEELD